MVTIVVTMVLGLFLRRRRQPPKERAMTIHYAVVKDDLVVDVRSSASAREYSHAVLYSDPTGPWAHLGFGVTYHRSVLHARKAASSNDISHLPVREVVPVVRTARRLKVGASAALAQVESTLVTWAAADEKAGL